MNRVKTFSKLAFAVALSSVVGFGAVTNAEAKCKPDPNAVCPLVYDPVICSNGQVYSNQCFANAACATGCVPYNQV
jgi:hypothetical protein